MSLAVAKCYECGQLIIYNPGATGFPRICDKCGVPADVEITQEQRMQMEQMKGKTYTVRL